MQRRKTDHNAKTYYRPIEAAIRWSGLTRYETRILRTLGACNLPPPDAFPRWPLLRLNAERLFDAMRHHELPYGRNGVNGEEPALLSEDAVELTVRHVDLKTWMAHYYPDQKPDFLFDEIERQLHPAISLEAVQTLLADREALRVQLIERLRQLDAFHEKAKRAASTDGLPLRSETTYLNIVGGLLSLMLGKSPAGVPYSSFETMDAIISALIAHYQGRPGISERTLWSKLAAAKRQIMTGTP